MRDKNVAGLLALLFGWLGFHRFYLGDVGLGILSAIFFWTGIPFILGLVDAIIFFSMDEDDFNYKYNRKSFLNRRNYEQRRNRNTDFDRYDKRRDRNAERYRDRRRERDIVEQPRYNNKSDYNKPSNTKAKQYRPAPKPTISNEPYKSSGIRKYKDYDYDGAIVDFKKALEINDKDIAVHFNIACAYSLNEEADLAFHHLDKAVNLGFNDFKKIKEHDAFAYLRIQDEFEVFEQNGFKLSHTEEVVEEEEEVITTEPESKLELPSENVDSGDLLQQLQKLGELRDKGLLTEEEFVVQKRRLLD